MSAAKDPKGLHGEFRGVKGVERPHPQQAWLGLEASPERVVLQLDDVGYDVHLKAALGERLGQIRRRCDETCCSVEESVYPTGMSRRVDREVATVEHVYDGTSSAMGYERRRLRHEEAATRIGVDDHNIHPASPTGHLRDRINQAH